MKVSAIEEPNLHPSRRREMRHSGIESRKEEGEIRILSIENVPSRRHGGKGKGELYKIISARYSDGCPRYTRVKKAVRIYERLGLQRTILETGKLYNFKDFYNAIFTMQAADKRLAEITKKQTKKHYLNKKKGENK